MIATRGATGESQPLGMPSTLDRLRLAGMDAQMVRHWRTLMRRQRALVREYLRAVGRGRSPAVLAQIRGLLQLVSVEVEALRRVIPRLPTEPY